MIPCYIFTAILFVIKLYRGYIACIMCLQFDRLETVIVYVLIKFCSVLFCSYIIIVIYYFAQCPFYTCMYFLYLCALTKGKNTIKLVSTKID